MFKSICIFWFFLAFCLFRKIYTCIQFFVFWVFFFRTGKKLCLKCSIFTNIIKRKDLLVCLFVCLFVYWINSKTTEPILKSCYQCKAKWSASNMSGILNFFSGARTKRLNLMKMKTKRSISEHKEIKGYNAVIFLSWNFPSRQSDNW